MRHGESRQGHTDLHPNDEADRLRPDLAGTATATPVATGVATRDDRPPEIGENTVVVGVDGSDASRAAVRWAVAHAESTGRRVAAVTAWQEPVQTAARGARGRTPNEHEARAGAQAVVAAETAADVPVLAERGHAGVVLSARSRGAALLVLGNPRPGRLTAPASTTVDCLRTADVPVVLVPTEDVR